MKKTFSVTLDNPEDFQEYAKNKGFRSVADLARFTLNHYMTRYPLKTSRASRLHGSDSKFSKVDSNEEEENSGTS